MRPAFGVLFVVAALMIGNGESVAVVAAATTPSPAPVHATMWPHFFRLLNADYDSQQLTPRQRAVIRDAVALVSQADRKYVRWEMWYGDPIVFEVKPSQLRSDGRGYSPSRVINDPLFYVDPADGSVFAGPPDSSPRIYASRWNPTCFDDETIPVSPPPAARAVPTARPIPPSLWPGFLKPTIADYDAAHLDQASRELIDHIVGSLPPAERPDVRWVNDWGRIEVFEVALAQFCKYDGYKASPVINLPRTYVNPLSGELFIEPPDMP